LVSGTTPSNNGRFPFKHRGSPFIGLPPAQGSDYEFNAGVGSYAVTGATAGLLGIRGLTLGPGAYAITGANADLLAESPGNFVMSLDPGTYGLTGAAPSSMADRVLVAGLGAYILEGKATKLRDSSQTTAGPGFLLRRRRRQQKGESS